MALTLQQLQAQRDAIVTELGLPASTEFTSGATSRRITRRPQPELEAALRRIDGEIAGLQPQTQRTFVITTNRGIA